MSRFQGILRLGIKTEDIFTSGSSNPTETKKVKGVVRSEKETVRGEVPAL